MLFFCNASDSMEWNSFFCRICIEREKTRPNFVYESNKRFVGACCVRYTSRRKKKLENDKTELSFIHCCHWVYWNFFPFAKFDTIQNFNLCPININCYISYIWYEIKIYIRPFVELLSLKTFNLNSVACSVFTIYRLYYLMQSIQFYQFKKKKNWKRNGNSEIYSLFLCLLASIALSFKSLSQTKHLIL